MLQLLWILFCLTTVTDAFTIGGESSLRDHIFNNQSYDPKVRPSGRVSVKIMYNLITINTFDFKEESLKLSGWLTASWLDDRLSWDITKYGNVTYIFSSDIEVWRPALIISNSIGNMGVIQDEYTPIRILNLGRIIWEPAGIYEVKCSPDITYYPFDTQLCNIVVQSWGYNLREVNISVLEFTGNGINLEVFQKNGEWDLIDNYTEWGGNTDTKGDDYAQIRIYFLLRRKVAYYWLNFILPVIVNALMTSLVFALPAESGEKMGYSLTVFLSFSVILTLISDKIPSTSTSTPLIVIYFAVVLIMGAVAVGLSTLSLNLYSRSDDQTIPQWYKCLFMKGMSKLVCFKRRPASTSKVGDIPQKVDSPRNASDTDGDGGVNTLKGQSFLLHQLRPRDNSWVDPYFEVSWQDISRILDMFLLRLYLLFVGALTFGIFYQLS